MSDLLTFDNWNEKRVNSIFNHKPDALDVLKWAYQEYQDHIVYACSFGAEGIVLIDLIYKVNKNAKIIFLDTYLHFKETYQLIERIKKRYPTLDIEMLQPKLSIEEQEKWYGENLWQANPNLCCHLRKIAPLNEALSKVQAWISGLRREQSIIRSKTEYINKDLKFQKIKICPLIFWTWQEIMDYIHLYKLPYNPLHDQGLPSIGCAPCTQPINADGDLRSGRWVGHSKTECGLHQSQS